MCCVTEACDRWIRNVYRSVAGGLLHMLRICDLFCAESLVASLLGRERTSRMGVWLRAARRKRPANEENSHHIVDNKVRTPASRLKVQIHVMHSNCLCPQTMAPKLQSHEIPQVNLQPHQPSKTESCNISTCRLFDRLCSICANRQNSTYSIELSPAP
jgi:hypothetical protein